MAKKQTRSIRIPITWILNPLTKKLCPSACNAHPGRTCPSRSNIPCTAGHNDCAAPGGDQFDQFELRPTCCLRCCCQMLHVLSTVIADDSHCSILQHRLCSFKVYQLELQTPQSFHGMIQLGTVGSLHGISWPTAIRGPHPYPKTEKCVSNCPTIFNIWHGLFEHDS